MKKILLMLLMVPSLTLAQTFRPLGIRTSTGALDGYTPGSVSNWTNVLGDAPKNTTVYARSNGVWVVMTGGTNASAWVAANSNAVQYMVGQTSTWDAASAYIASHSNAIDYVEVRTGYWDSAWNWVNSNSGGVSYVFGQTGTWDFVSSYVLGNTGNLAYVFGQVAYWDQAITNVLLSPSNNWGSTKVFGDYVVINYPTNLVTASITNGLWERTEGTNWVDTNYYPRNNPSNWVTASITNGLETSSHAAATYLPLGSQAVDSAKLDGYSAEAFSGVPSSPDGTIFITTAVTPDIPRVVELIINSSYSNALMAASSNSAAGIYLPITGTNSMASTNWVTGLGYVTQTITNGLVTSAVTNGLETASHASATYLPITGTNALAATNWVTGLGYVTQTVTNGLETASHASATYLPITGTNGLETAAHASATDRKSVV